MRVVQLTDIHMPADPEDDTVMEMLAGIDLLDPADTLAAVLDDVASLTTPADLVVCTGDLGDRGHPASYRRLNAMLDALGIPVLVLPGNHDLPDAFDEHLPGGSGSSTPSGRMTSATPAPPSPSRPEPRSTGCSSSSGTPRRPRHSGTRTTETRLDSSATYALAGLLGGAA